MCGETENIDMSSSLGKGMDTSNSREFNNSKDTKIAVTPATAGVHGKPRLLYNISKCNTRNVFKAETNATPRSVCTSRDAARISKSRDFQQK